MVLFLLVVFRMVVVFLLFVLLRLVWVKTRMVLLVLMMFLLFVMLRVLMPFLPALRTGCVAHSLISSALGLALISIFHN